MHNIDQTWTGVSMRRWALCGVMIACLLPAVNAARALAAGGAVASRDGGPVGLSGNEDVARSLNPVTIAAREIELAGPDAGGGTESEVLPVDGFRLASHETRREEYAAFIAAEGYERRELWSDEGWTWREDGLVQAPLNWEEQVANPDELDLPVVGISFYEAEAFANWVGGRLPSELEWEAALRGPDSLRYGWGNAWDGALANTLDSGALQLAPVGVESATPDGVEDLIGSVWEWTDICITDYPGYPEPTDYRATMHALRGGSYWDRDWEQGILPQLRNFQDAGYRQANTGFRVAFDLPEDEELPAEN